MVYTNRKAKKCKVKTYSMCYLISELLRLKTEIVE